MLLQLVNIWSAGGRKREVEDEEAGGAEQEHRDYTLKIDCWISMTN